jgi:RimJ/RimL family protein N-acetyltransferase
VRFRIDWVTPNLHAYEPTLEELETYAPALAAAWNDPQNARLMGHGDSFDEEDVVDHYEAIQAGGGRGFLLFHGEALAGDADFRGVSSVAAEFAFMVASPAAQGKGLGTRFAIMLHRFAFTQLGLQHSYASIDPINVGSRRVFEKLGFRVDESPAARAFADEPHDVVMSIDRETFERLHAEVFGSIVITNRNA